MLKVVGRDGPVGSPTDEEDHLLAGADLVDDTGDSGAVEGATGSERSKPGCDGGVGDGGRVVPEALSGDSSIAKGIVSSRGLLHTIRDALTSSGWPWGTPWCW